LNLFPRPLPPNLITVPACQPCHTAKSRDDEFLRDYLMLDSATSGHPIAETIFSEKVTRALQRRSSELARFVVRQRVEMIPTFTPTGVFVGESVRASLPTGRVESIITRMVRGLYFSARRVPMHPKVTSSVLVHPSTPIEVLQANLGPDPMRAAFPGVFGVAFVETVQLHSLWVLWFYDRVLFTAHVVPPRAAA
jgi:hypothetical protein